MYIENERKENKENKENKKNEEKLAIPSINLYEVQNLMEVLGIRKNEIEINCSIKKLKGDKPKCFL